MRPPMLKAVFTNEKEVMDLLSMLPVEVETKIMRNAVTAGAREVRDEARVLAPKQSGAMAQAIKVTRSTSFKEGHVAAKVRLKGRHAFLGRFMEYGVLPHLIWTRGKGSLVINGVPIGKQVWHPGHGARPFMRPAMDNKADDVKNTINNYLKTYLKFGTISVPEVAVDDEEAA